MAQIAEVIHKVLEDMFDQVPTMTVEKVTLTPSEPSAGDEVTARIDVANSRYVLCRIKTAPSDGAATLFSARVVEA